jgi:hypothetical protein
LGVGHLLARDEEEEGFSQLYRIDKDQCRLVTPEDEDAYALEQGLQKLSNEYYLFYQRDQQKATGETYVKRLADGDATHNSSKELPYHCVFFHTTGTAFNEVARLYMGDNDWGPIPEPKDSDLLALSHWASVQVNMHQNDKVNPADAFRPRWLSILTSQDIDDTITGHLCEEFGPPEAPKEHQILQWAFYGEALPQSLHAGEKKHYELYDSSNRNFMLDTGTKQ